MVAWRWEDRGSEGEGEVKEVGEDEGGKEGGERERCGGRTREDVLHQLMRGQRSEGKTERGEEREKRGQGGKRRVLCGRFEPIDEADDTAVIDLRQSLDLRPDSPASEPYD